MDTINAAEWLEATFAKNRTLYSGFTMELDNDSDPAEGAEGEAETPEPEDAPEDAPNEGAEGDENTPEEPDEEGEEDSSTLPPAEALKALKKARKEAGNYRTRLRTVEAQLANAKTPEEFQAAVDQIKADNEAEAIALHRENVALRFKLPDDVAATLHGKSKDELEAHAKVLAKYIVSNDGDPEYQGGLDPDSDTGGSDDVAATVKRVRQNRY